MYRGACINVVIPAFNEERSIGHVLDAIPDWVDAVVVANNASTDRTSEVAATHGAIVVDEPQRGYGAACLAGIAAIDAPDIVVFLDGDASDLPEEMSTLVDPIVDGHVDMTIGSRVLGDCEPGSLTPQQRWGNWLACTLIRWIWDRPHTDLGPFRAIRYHTLVNLDMRDRDFGWTVEMQVKAAKRWVPYGEVPVSYRKRIGESKISGTVKGVFAAGTKILYTIFREALYSGVSTTASSHRIVVFTRLPNPGESKTRMIPTLGTEGAADLQRAMTVHALTTARRARRSIPLEIEVQYTGGTEAELRAWLGPDVGFAEQEGADLGARMHNAVRRAVEAGVDRVVLMGADCPTITPEHLTRALYARADVTIGPAEDGGYYLIAMSNAHAELFADIAWGTGEVFAKTISACESAGVSVLVLPTLSDVDRPEDLRVWEEAHAEPQCAQGTVSVVIPTLNEAPRIAQTLANLSRESGTELIVADGGSTDGTPELAEHYGARVVHAPKGRGAQMNAGVNAATGDTLLFLHADTALRDGYAQVCRETLDAPEVAAGAFKLHLASSARILRTIERIANFRARYMQLPYGDQGLFLKKSTYDCVGPFSEIPIMEDYEYVKRLRRHARIRIVDEHASTSARRWEQTGALRLTLRHWAIVLGYKLGVSPHRLARWRG
jgi:hypothetical protein